MKVPKENTQPEPSQTPETKPVKRIPYIGVWMIGKGGNDPILVYHPEFAEQVESLLTPLKGQIIRASIQMEEKPLITRLNLRGLRDVATGLLQKAFQP